MAHAVTRRCGTFPPLYAVWGGPPNEGGGGGGCPDLQGPPVHLDVLVLDREIRYTNSLLEKTWAKSTSISIFLPKPHVRLSVETNESRC